MDCSRCEDKRCMALQACPASKTDQEALRADYQDSDRQPLVQAAARLVDGGRAGSLNRVEETIEYARDLGLEKLGLAYCYAFDAEADLLRRIFKREGFSLCCVRCTASGLAQQEINSESPLPSVSCNPLAQARQLDAEGHQVPLLAIQKACNWSSSWACAWDTTSCSSGS